MSKTKYADSVVELDTRIGRIMDKLKALGLDKNTLVFYTTDNGAWQDVYPDAGYTPFRGTKGTVREGGNRVPAIAMWPGKIKAGAKNHEIVGGLDLMATFASDGGVKLPEKDRDGQPIIFDSYDMTPVLTGTGQGIAAQELVLLHRERAVARRGPHWQVQGGVQPARRQRRADRRPVGRFQPGLEGRRRSMSRSCRRSSTCGRTRRSAYDIFMNNFTERTWTMVPIGPELDKLMKTYVQYPPRKLQSIYDSGPIEISNYQKFQYRARLAGEGRHQHPAADGQLTGGSRRLTGSGRHFLSGRPRSSL
jgi:hypothetical protein